METVEREGAVGKYLSALRGPDGFELIYLDQTHKTLRYARMKGGAWQFQDIASDNLPGAAEKDSFSGELPVAGDYMIRVGMMRNQARRNATSNYTLHVGVQ